MDPEFHAQFMNRWRRYFSGSDLPIAYYYADEAADEDRAASREVDRCLICNIYRVQQGVPYVYHAQSPGCAGAKRYAGFTQTLRPDFEAFLSCGIPGRVEGERYKASPELVREHLAQHPPFEAPGTHLIFKRWDRLREDEEPLAVVFFATPDVLAGLFTLANYDVANSMGVIAPMGSGCASIVQYAYQETASETPRCILGMFDVSARPCVPPNVLTFAVPMKRLRTMASNMDESFLTTPSWRDVVKRI